MDYLIPTILWAIQFVLGSVPAAMATAALFWMSAENEVCRFVRVAGEARRGQGRMDDAIWVIQNYFALCCLLCIGLAWWGVAAALSSFHSILWAMPTLILLAGFWSYMLADTRGMISLLQERRMWITGRSWIDNSEDD